MDEAPEVRAAGCALWRPSRGPDGIDVALVHRPKWQDWSLPKGKLQRDESEREAAVREVLEETGMVCELGPELATLRYPDAQGRSKTVRYWAAEATSGAFFPNREVSLLLWLPPEDACARVTREQDAELIRALVGVLRASGVVS